MNVSQLQIRKGSFLVVKYPQHGTRNILCKHEGKVEGFGVGPNGPYAVLRSAGNKVRTLRFDRMIDPVCS